MHIHIQTPQIILGKVSALVRMELWMQQQLSMDSMITVITHKFICLSQNLYLTRV